VFFDFGFVLENMVTVVSRAVKMGGVLLAKLTSFFSTVLRCPKSLKPIGYEFFVFLVKVGVCHDIRGRGVDFFTFYTMIVSRFTVVVTGLFWVRFAGTIFGRRESAKPVFQSVFFLFMHVVVANNVVFVSEALEVESFKLQLVVLNFFYLKYLPEIRKSAQCSDSVLYEL